MLALAWIRKHLLPDRGDLQVIVATIYSNQAEGFERRGMRGFLPFIVCRILPFCECGDAAKPGDFFPRE